MDLALAPIRTIEPAIKARLRLAFPSKVFQIERIPPVLTIEEFKRVVRLTPFIGLAWLGIKPDPASGRQLAAAMRWRLVMIVKASSSLEARFKGDTRDIGMDAMIDVAVALLQGAVFDGIGASAVTGAEAVFVDGWADEATVVANLDFEVRYQFSLAALQLKTIDDFKSLHVTWLNADSPEGGAVDAPQTVQPNL
ncbi:MAG TPA: hypothetical protein VGV39_00945 [Mesorhizobium sp.]|jgi:phage gp37-like protein|uniref:hypothetical protein n=1 Tax=Mesorhizobium sp. TaxID=1871066 RepID=UPI002DDCC68B|nr:hypothetical protein [Mesorhizobium sp.]HEV2501608.1 hypothetical protein [Mesorhizobium sp.]